MKIQIRQGIFETNSSSVHTVSIWGKQRTGEYPRNLEFRAGEFGWEEAIYHTPTEKASYLWTLLINKFLDDRPELFKYYKQKIYNALVSVNVMPIFVMPGYKEESYHYQEQINTYKEFVPYIGIDHYTEFTDEDVHYIVDNQDILLDYLFNNKSVVETGNDNADSVPEPRVGAAWSTTKRN